jgi:hypothetical protein
MISYKEIKATWSSGACPPDGLQTNTIYSIIKKNGKLHISDGNIEFLWDKFCITTFLSPDNGLTWDQVDFEEIDTKKQKIDSYSKKYTK